MRPGDVVTPTHAFSFRTGSSLHHRIWWDRDEHALVLALDGFSTPYRGECRRILLMLHDGVPRWIWLAVTEAHVCKATAA